jgi:hypothetical protein
VTSSVNGISPEANGSFILTEHCSCHLDESSILSLHHSILLRSICSREFMSDTIIIEKIINMSIFEFSPIITSDMLDGHIMFILSFLGKSLEDLLSPGFIF